jgi:ribosomal protein S4E
VKIKAKETLPGDKVEIKTQDGKGHKVTVDHIECPDVIVVTKSGRRFQCVGEEFIELLNRNLDG